MTRLVFVMQEPVQKTYVVATTSGRAEGLFDHLKAIALTDEQVFESVPESYHRDLRLCNDPKPTIPAVIFLHDLTTEAALLNEIKYAREYFPSCMFVLVGSEENLVRIQKVPSNAGHADFRNYFSVRVQGDQPPEEFRANLRSIIRLAKEASVRRCATPRFGQVFISYSHSDAKFARWLRDELVSYGVPVWIDGRRMKLGESVEKSIEAAIASGSKVLLCASKNSLQSIWVQKEIKIALSHEDVGKTVLLPLDLDGKLRESRAYSDLNLRLTANFRDWEKFLNIHDVRGRRSYSAMEMLSRFRREVALVRAAILLPN